MVDTAECFERVQMLLPEAVSHRNELGVGAGFLSTYFRSSIVIKAAAAAAAAASSLHPASHMLAVTRWHFRRIVSWRANVPTCRMLPFLCVFDAIDKSAYSIKEF